MIVGGLEGAGRKKGKIFWSVLGDQGWGKEKRGPLLGKTTGRKSFKSRAILR